MVGPRVRPYVLWLEFIPTQFMIGVSYAVMDVPPERGAAYWSLAFNFGPIAFRVTRTAP